MKSFIEDFKNRSPRIDEWLVRQAAPYVEKNPNEVFREDLEHIIHYLESSDAPRKIGKISYQLAHTQAAQWIVKLNEKNKLAESLKEATTDTSEMMKDGSYTWVKLLTQAAYNREGRLMGHCVANYYQQKANTVIYSLRDEDNMPHCTIEMTDNKIRQIKGRANQEVVSKYHYTLRKFIQQTNIPVQTYDAWKYGWLVINNKLVDETELPDVIDLTSERGHKVGLSGFAKIPKVMKVPDITIRDQRNLDLSNWEVGSSLTLENCRNVILPAKDLPQRLTLIDVKFAPEEKAKLKEEELMLTTIKLIRTDLVIKSLTVNEISGIENCSLYTKKLELKEQKELKLTTPGKIVTEHLSVVKYQEDSKFEVKFMFLTVGQIDLTDNLLEKIDNIFLRKQPKVMLLTKKPFKWPKHWGDMFLMEMDKSHLTDVDFTNLKTLGGLKVFNEFIISAPAINENIVSFLHDGKVVKPMRLTKICK